MQSVKLKLATILKNKRLVIVLSVALALIIVGLLALVIIGRSNRANETQHLDRAADSYTSAVARYASSLQPGEANQFGARTTIIGNYAAAPKLTASDQPELSAKYQAAQKLQAAITVDRRYISQIIDTYASGFRDKSLPKLIAANSDFYLARSNATVAVNQSILNSISSGDDAVFYNGKVDYYKALMNAATTYKESVNVKGDVPVMYGERFNKLRDALDNYAKGADTCRQSLEDVKDKNDVTAVTDAEDGCEQTIDRRTFVVNRYSNSIVSYTSYASSDLLTLQLQQLKTHAQIKFIDVTASHDEVAQFVHTQNALQSALLFLPLMRSDSDPAFVVKADIARVLTEEASGNNALLPKTATGQLQTIKSDLTLFDGFSINNQAADSSGGYYTQLLDNLLAKNQRPYVETDTSDRKKYQAAINASLAKIQKLNTPQYAQPQVDQVVQAYKQAAELAKQYEQITKQSNDLATYIQLLNQKHSAIGAKLDETEAALGTLADRLDDYVTLRQSTVDDINKALASTEIK